MNHTQVSFFFSWFFEGIRRVDSERLLKRQRGNITGSFLVRRAECLERPRDEFSLSILDKDNSVKHYKIFRDEKGMFHLNRHEAFSSLQNLITKYLQAKKINNYIHLTVPCVRVSFFKSIFSCLNFFIKLLFYICNFRMMDHMKRKDQIGRRRPKVWKSKKTFISILEISFLKRG